jgi:dipeptidyl aminopeptidase/acylaminoacyl peptidase
MRRYVSVLFTLIGVAPARAETVPSVSPGTLGFIRVTGATRRFPEAAISPDGGRVAFVQEEPSGDGGSSAMSLFVATTGSSASPRRIAVGAGKVPAILRDLAWSTDSRRLAFLADADTSGQFQLYVALVSGTSAQRVTNLNGSLTKAAWSPDARSVAVLFTENARDPVGPTAAKAPAVGVVEESLDVQRIATVDLSSRAVRTVSPPELYVHEFDWSPDGRRFVATAAPPPGDDGWYVAELFSIDATSGTARSIFKPPLQIGCPRFSRDGKSVAFIAGLMSDEGVLGGEILVLPAAGGEAQNLTPGRDASPSWLAWFPSSREILFAENADGGSGLATVALDGKTPRILWRGAERLSGPIGLAGPALSVASDGKTTAVVRQSFAKPPEIWAGRVGEWAALTRANASVQGCWGAAESLSWRSDGLAVQGWLVHPKEEARRSPLVVSIHGGPASAVVPSWPSSSSPVSHACDGRFVFFPNPRGSHGRGQDFVRANVKDLGGGDLRDVLAGVDEVVKTRAVDEARLGVEGWSYGGFMTMWTVTQTRRFRAAMAGAGIANWQSYYGQNGIARWMLPYFGASVYDDPAVYAKSSAINFIKSARTPTLVVVGERDIECPPPQSFEFWRALKAHGVKTELVVYAGEGHGFAKPENRQDLLRRTTAWFREQLEGR